MKATPITKVVFINATSSKLLERRLNASLLDHSVRGLMCFKVKVKTRNYISRRDDTDSIYTAKMLFTNDTT